MASAAAVGDRARVPSLPGLPVVGHLHRIARAGPIGHLLATSRIMPEGIFKLNFGSRVGLFTAFGDCAAPVVRRVAGGDAFTRTGEKAGRSPAETGSQARSSMMANSKSSADKVKDAINDKIVDPAKKAGEAMRKSGARVAEGGATVSMRLIDQAEQNAREAFAALRNAAKAKDLSEVMKVQGDYLREQGTRSMTQAREIGELIVKIGQESVAPLRGKD